MQQLRVALLAPCFWPEVRRGGERMIRDLADGLIADGHRPRLITSHAGIATRTVEDGLPIERSRRLAAGLLARRGFEEHLTHLPATFLALRRGHDDVAHAFYPTDALVAARWARRTGRPAVQTYLGTPTRRWLSARRLRLRVTLESLGGCTTVAISHAAAAEFHRWLGEDVRVIHPGVDLSSFAAGGSRAEVPTVFCAAAVDQLQKRVGLLVQAFALLRRRHPGARLVLSRPRDPAATAGYDSVDGVEFRDVDRREDLIGAYREAWVTALPSTGEAFGLVLVESLACGTPVVGSRLGAIPEVIDRPEIGRLFDGDQPRSLAAALLEAIDLSSDPATQAHCRERAEDFSLTRAVAAYELLYRELLEEA